MNRRQFITFAPLIATTLALPACVAPKTPEKFPEYYFDPAISYNLIIGQVVVNSQYQPTLNNIEGENKYINLNLFKRLVNTRFKKQGLLGSLTIDIINYGILEEKYQINSSTLSLFSAEAGSKFSAKWKANLRIDSPNFQSLITIDVADETTIGKETSLANRERELYLMGKRLIEKFDFKLQELVPIHFKPVMAG